ncbi:MAG: NAD(P)-dependent glycerol-3-phosphate dehydrogenase [Chloroflexi bacterium]|nr:NAD(P)-dependent glycerol-3-phosphate dehydrogenase [Chloroflexota bacterium]
MATMLAKKGHDVRLWARDAGLVEEMLATLRNPRYISNIEIPEEVSITSDLKGAVSGAEVIVMAVPSHAMRAVARSMAPLVSGGCMLVSLAKGLEEKSFKRMTELLAEEMPGCADSVAALSGPNHAEEVSVGITTATVVACRNRGLAERLQEIFVTSYFRVYTNPDVVGVELGGAVKNVIAIAVGVADGLGFGDNTRASLMTRGLAEMARLGVAMGAEERTFSGLSGVGDLIATCTSRHSRNRAVGERLGRGEDLKSITADMRMIAEGVRATGTIYELSVAVGVEMPIVRTAYEVLYEGRDVLSCVSELMTRDVTLETRN